MKRRNGDPRSNVISLAEFRYKRSSRPACPAGDDHEYVTDVRFAVTKSGKISTAPPRLHTHHLLAVLSWCQDVAALALDSYLDSAGHPTN